MLELQAAEQATEQSCPVWAVKSSWTLPVTTANSAYVELNIRQKGCKAFVTVSPAVARCAVSRVGDTEKVSRGATTVWTSNIKRL